MLLVHELLVAVGAQLVHLALVLQFQNSDCCCVGPSHVRHLIPGRLDTQCQLMDLFPSLLGGILRSRLRLPYALRLCVSILLCLSALSRDRSIRLSRLSPFCLPIVPTLARLAPRQTRPRPGPVGIQTSPGSRPKP